jgi:hypothetical protein
MKYYYYALSVCFLAIVNFTQTAKLIVKNNTNVTQYVNFVEYYKGTNFAPSKEATITLEIPPKGSKFGDKKDHDNTWHPILSITFNGKTFGPGSFELPQDALLSESSMNIGTVLLGWHRTAEFEINDGPVLVLKNYWPR